MSLTLKSSATTSSRSIAGSLTDQRCRARAGTASVQSGRQARSARRRDSVAVRRRATRRAAGFIARQVSAERDHDEHLAAPPERTHVGAC